MPQLMDERPTDYQLEYARKLFDVAMNWYKSAEIKAQIILTLNGGFLALLGSDLFFGKELNASVNFTPIMQLLFAIFLASLAASILFALLCVKSRFSKLDVEANTLRDDKGRKTGYKPEITYFFDYLRQLDPNLLYQQLRQFTKEDETRLMIDQAIGLSKNVKTKHRFVNYSFLFFGASLIIYLFLVAISSLGS